MAQPTSIALPDDLNFPVLFASWDAELATATEYHRLLTPLGPRLQNPQGLGAQERADLSAQLALAGAAVPLHNKAAARSYARLAWSFLMQIGEPERADAVHLNWVKHREKMGWYRPADQWLTEIHGGGNNWFKLRDTEGYNARALSRMRNWQGLGVNDDAPVSIETTIALEFVLYWLGGIEAKVFLFEDLRPRILKKYPAGHPLRALCEARWSFTQRRLGRLQESRKIVDAAMAELVPNRPDANRRIELTLIREAATVYASLGDFERAGALTAGVPVEVEQIYPADHFERGYAWGQRANILTGLGDYEAAISAWHKAMETDDRNARMRLGVLLLQIGRTTEGQDLVWNAVDPDDVWTAWGWIGAAAMVEQRLTEGDAVFAQRWLDGAARAVKGLFSPAASEHAYLALLQAQVARLRGDADLQRRSLAEALARASDARNPANLLRALFEWADVRREMGAKADAIRIGKFAAHSLQAHRLAAASGAEKPLPMVSLAFQRGLNQLVGLLIDEGRLPEAEQIMAVLTAERYYDFMRSPRRYSASQAIALSDRELSLQASLQRLHPKANAVADALEAQWYRRAPAGTNADALSADLVLEAQQLLLGDGHAESSVARHVRENALTDLGAGTREAGVALRPDEAAVTFVLEPTRLRAIVTTKSGERVIALRVDTKELSRAAQRFRQVLARPDIDATLPAVALYKLVFQKIDAQLRKHGVQRVYLRAEGALRYVSFAALHDGNGYLVRRYEFVNIGPSADLPSAATLRPDQTRLAIFGAGEFVGLPTGEGGSRMAVVPLPYALDEVNAIGLAVSPMSTASRGGASAVNDHDVSVKLHPQFSRESLSAEMRGATPPNVIHIASHFLFSPSSAHTSMLYASDGTVSLAEMADWRWRDVELVTFSVCNSALVTDTESGDRQGSAASGLHETALRQGAKNVIASLWMVNDRSTALLMPKLYAAGLRSGEWGGALANAQRWMARGGAGRAYVHPHHWGAFVVYVGRG